VIIIRAGWKNSSRIALRKLAIEQQAGYFDKPHFRSGVVFSLPALREELKKHGHARSSSLR
jgi:hypothetical protein